MDELLKEVNANIEAEESQMGNLNNTVNHFNALASSFHIADDVNVTQDMPKLTEDFLREPKLTEDLLREPKLTEELLRVDDDEPKN